MYGFVHTLNKLAFFIVVVTFVIDGVVYWISNNNYTFKQHLEHYLFGNGKQLRHYLNDKNDVDNLIMLGILTLSRLLFAAYFFFYIFIKFFIIDVFMGFVFNFNLRHHLNSQTIVIIFSSASWFFAVGGIVTYVQEEINEMAIERQAAAERAERDRLAREAAAQAAAERAERDRLAREAAAQAAAERAERDRLAREAAAQAAAERAERDRLAREAAAQAAAERAAAEKAAQKAEERANWRENLDRRVAEIIELGRAQNTVKNESTLQDNQARLDYLKQLWAFQEAIKKDGEIAWLAQQASDALDRKQDTVAQGALDELMYKLGQDNNANY